MKILGKLNRINWGQTITIRDFDKFECHINPYAEDETGIPSEHHTEIAKTIITAVSDHEELVKVLYDILDELDGTAYQTSMNCHIEKATELLKRIKF